MGLVLGRIYGMEEKRSFQSVQSHAWHKQSVARKKLTRSFAIASRLICHSSMASWRMQTRLDGVYVAVHSWRFKGVHSEYNENEPNTQIYAARTFVNTSIVVFRMQSIKIKRDSSFVNLYPDVFENPTPSVSMSWLSIYCSHHNQGLRQRSPNFLDAGPISRSYPASAGRTILCIEIKKIQHVQHQSRLYFSIYFLCSLTCLQYDLWNYFVCYITVVG